MPLDPHAQAYVETVGRLQPPNWELTPPEVRARAIIPPAGPEVHEVMEMEAAGPDGPIPIRIYWPREGQDLPALVWLHGGGWVQGSLDGADAVARRLCTLADCVVVSVGYRLAPEHPFPAGVTDAYAIAVWTVQNAPRLNVDPERVAIGGDSAGGNLATVVAQLLRDRGGPRLVHQLLVYPVVDAACDTPSYRENTSHGLTPQMMTWFFGHYCPEGIDRLQPMISPIRARNLSGLPPATVITAEYDPLRDEGNAYAEALAAAGVPTELRSYAGQVHTFFVNTHLMPVGLEAVEWAASRLREAFTR